MKTLKLTKNKVRIRLIAFIVISTLLCQNITWANTDIEYYISGNKGKKELLAPKQQILFLNNEEDLITLALTVYEVCGYLANGKITIQTKIGSLGRIKNELKNKLSKEQIENILDIMRKEDGLIYIKYTVNEEELLLRFARKRVRDNCIVIAESEDIIDGYRLQIVRSKIKKVKASRHWQECGCLEKIKEAFSKEFEEKKRSIIQRFKKNRDLDLMIREYSLLLKETVKRAFHSAVVNISKMQEPSQLFTVLSKYMEDNCEEKIGKNPFLNRNLLENISVTLGKIKLCDLRKLLKRIANGKGFVLFSSGSMARHEASFASDIDLLLIIEDDVNADYKHILLFVILYAYYLLDNPQISLRIDLQPWHSVCTMDEIEDYMLKNSAFHMSRLIDTDKIIGSESLGEEFRFRLKRLIDEDKNREAIFGFNVAHAIRSLDSIGIEDKIINIKSIVRQLRLITNLLQCFSGLSGLSDYIFVLNRLEKKGIITKGEKDFVLNTMRFFWLIRSLNILEIGKTETKDKIGAARLINLSEKYKEIFDDFRKVGFKIGNNSEIFTTRKYIAEEVLNITRRGIERVYKRESVPDKYSIYKLIEFIRGLGLNHKLIAELSESNDSERLGNLNKIFNEEIVNSVFGAYAAWYIFCSDYPASFLENFNWNAYPIWLKRLFIQFKKKDSALRIQRKMLKSDPELFNEFTAQLYRDAEDRMWSRIERYIQKAGLCSEGAFSKFDKMNSITDYRNKLSYLKKKSEVILQRLPPKIREIIEAEVDLLCQIEPLNFDRTYRTFQAIKHLSYEEFFGYVCFRVRELLGKDYNPLKEENSKANYIALKTLEMLKEKKILDGKDFRTVTALSIAGNYINFGREDRMGLGKERVFDILSRCRTPSFIDEEQFNLFIEDLTGQPRDLLIITDNNGEIVYDMYFAKQYLAYWHRKKPDDQLTVTFVCKQYPTINDVSVIDLREILNNPEFEDMSGDVRIVASGTNGKGFNINSLSSELRSILGRDREVTILIKGQTCLFSSIYSIESFIKGYPNIHRLYYLFTPKGRVGWYITGPIKSSKQYEEKNEEGKRGEENIHRQVFVGGFDRNGALNNWFQQGRSWLNKRYNGAVVGCFEKAAELRKKLILGEHSEKDIRAEVKKYLKEVLDQNYHKYNQLYPEEYSLMLSLVGVADEKNKIPYFTLENTITRGAIIINLTGTVIERLKGSEYTSLKEAPLKEELLNVLRVGFKVYILSGNDYSEIIKSNFIKFIPIELRKGIVIYANNGCQRVYFDEQGNDFFDVEYSQDKLIDERNLPKLREIAEKILGEFKKRFYERREYYENNYPNIPFEMVWKVEQRGNTEMGGIAQLAIIGIPYEERYDVMEKIYQELPPGYTLYSGGAATIGIHNANGGRFVAIKHILDSSNLIPEEVVYLDDEIDILDKDIKKIINTGITINAVNPYQWLVAERFPYLGEGLEGTKNFLIKLLQEREHQKSSKAPQSSIGCVCKKLKTQFFDRITDDEMEELAGKYSFFGNISLARKWVKEWADIRSLSFDTMARLLLYMPRRPRRYPMMPEEMWIYTLPAIAYARKNNFEPLFLERGALPFVNPWINIVTKLKKMGVDNIPQTCRSIRIIRDDFKGSPDKPLRLGLQISSILKSSEVEQIIKEDVKSQLIGAFNNMPEEDRNIINKELTKLGISGGFAALMEEDLNRGKIISYLADIGIDQRFLEQLKRLRLITNKFSDLISIYLRSGVNRLTPEIILKTIGNELLEEERSFLKELLDKIKDKKRGIILYDRVSLRSLLGLIIAKSAVGELKGHTNHITRPLLNIILKDTEFAQELNSHPRRLLIDESIASGSSKLICELLCKAFSEKVICKFAPIYLVQQEIERDFEGKLIVDVYAVAGEVTPPEDNLFNIELISSIESKGGIRVIKKVKYSDLKNKMRQSIFRSGKSSARLSLNEIQMKSLELRKEIHKFLSNHPGIFRGLKDLELAESHPPFYLKEEIVKHAVGSKTIISELMVNEFFLDFSIGRLNRRKFRSSVRKALEKLSQIRDNELEEIKILVELLRPYHELSVIEHLLDKYSIFQERQRIGLETLKDNEIKSLVLSYLENPLPNQFEKVREKATSKLCVYPVSYIDYRIQFSKFIQDEIYKKIKHYLLRLQRLINQYWKLRNGKEDSREDKMKTVKDEIKKIVDEINSNRLTANLPPNIQPCRIFRLETFLEEPDSAEYINEAKRALLSGQYVPEFFFAGFAGRLVGSLKKCGVQIEDERQYLMYGLEIRSLLEQPNVKKKLGISQKILLTPKLGMGPRQIMVFRLFLENLVVQEGLSSKEILQKQCLIVHINEDNQHQVLDDFIKNDFYGFAPENVFFIVQDLYGGHLLTKGKLIYSPERNQRPFGHGYAAMQLVIPYTAFNLLKNGERKYLSEDILTYLQAKGGRYIATHRVNDLTKLSPRTVVDIEKLAYSMYAIEEKHKNIVFEAVENDPEHPGEGGYFGYDAQTGKIIIIEDTESRGVGQLKEFINCARRDLYPYNAFRSISEIRALRLLLIHGLDYELRFNRGFLYLESGFSNISKQEGALVSVFKREDERIHDFKEVNDIPEALAFMEESNYNRQFNLSRNGDRTKAAKLTDERCKGIKQRSISIEKAKALFGNFGNGREESIGLPMQEAKARYKAGLQVFNEIMSAEQGSKRTVEEIDINIKVVKTFTGRVRIVGLEGLPRNLQEIIGVMAKLVHSKDRLAGQVTRREETKYILVDKDRLDEMDKEGYSEVVSELSKNNYQIVIELSKVPEDVDLKNVIHLVDPSDLEKIPEEERVKGMFYLPMPYLRSSLYMAAVVIASGGDVDRLNPLVKGLIGDLYSQIFGRSISAEDLEKLFKRPWLILPEIRSVLGEMNKLRSALVEIEKAA